MDQTCHGLAQKKLIFSSGSHSGDQISRVTQVTQALRLVKLCQLPLRVSMAICMSPSPKEDRTWRISPTNVFYGPSLEDAHTVSAPLSLARTWSQGHCEGGWDLSCVSWKRTKQIWEKASHLCHRKGKKKTSICLDVTGCIHHFHPTFLLLISIWTNNIIILLGDLPKASGVTCPSLSFSIFPPHVSL